MRFFSATLCLVVMISGLGACSRTEPTPDPVRAVRTLTVQDQTTLSHYEYAADVRPRVESRLGFRVSGKLVKRLVELGDSVRAGQVLAELDPQDLKLALDNARAQQSAAQASYDLAAADYKRYKDLRDQNFISVAELERRETALKAAQAQLNQAQAQSRVQSNQSAYTVLVSDVSGVITGVDAEPGMVVTSGSTILRVAQNGPRDVVFSVPEDKIARIRVLAATSGAFKARAWTVADEWSPLHVREIAAAADPVTRTFLVKAELDGKASAGVSLGQTMTVKVDLPPIAGVTKLPLSALKEDKGRSAVWVVDSQSMTVHLQEVTVAGAEGNDAVISQGLQSGQVVVTAGVHVLTPGQKVKLWRESGQAPAPVAKGMSVGSSIMTASSITSAVK